MKNKFFGFLIMAVFITASALTTVSAQSKTDDKGVFTATVTINPRTVNNQGDVVIHFSKPVTDGLEYYKVIGAAKTHVRGKSKLIMALYYEPGLLAHTIEMKDDLIRIYFLRGKPQPTQMTNILNRIIQTVHQHTAPNLRLEVDGYDPLLGVEMPKPKLLIPKPILVQ